MLNGGGLREWSLDCCWLLLCNPSNHVTEEHFLSISIPQHPPHHHQHPALNIQHSIASSLRKIMERLWVLHNRQLDFESVVLFSHTAPLNQTLSCSMSLLYIPRYRYYSPGLSTTVRAIPIISLFTKTHHRHWNHPPFFKQSMSLLISPINTDSHWYPKGSISSFVIQCHTVSTLVLINIPKILFLPNLPLDQYELDFFWTSMFFSFLFYILAF